MLNEVQLQALMLQVHSLNILRALYKDTRLADDVFPYIAEGLKASIVGYASQLWPVREQPFNTGGGSAKLCEWGKKFKKSTPFPYDYEKSQPHTVALKSVFPNPACLYIN